MSARMAARRRRVATRLGVIALVWSSGLLLAALFVPAYTSDSTSEVNGMTVPRSTLAQENGARAIALVAVLLAAAVRLAPGPPAAGAGGAGDVTAAAATGT